MSALVIGFGVVAGGAVIAYVFKNARAELARRERFFGEAKEALGSSFGPFGARSDGRDGQESAGTHDGAKARFAVDRIATEARLDLPVPKGVDKGAVFDLVVHEGKGALETGREDVLVGWDDEHDLLIFRTTAQRPAAQAVKALLEEAKAFRASLPERLRKVADERRERRARIFGDDTGPRGIHRRWGIGLPGVSAETWELVRERPDSLAWERDQPDALPAETRLMAARQDPALAAEDARARLLDRIAHAFVEALPDGSFEGAPPEELDAHAASDVGGWKSAVVTVDYLREVVVREEETEARPYRHVVRGVFAPWAVLVVEVSAPKDEAEKVVDSVLAGAVFEDPSKLADGAK